jgi:hypothetical protein
VSVNASTTAFVLIADHVTASDTFPSRAGAAETNASAPPALRTTE